MEQLNNKGLSRRTFLKSTGAGMGAMAISMPGLAFENVFNNHEGAVATAQLKNAGLLEQAQINEQFKRLTDVLNLKISETDHVLIVLGQVTDLAFPYSVDHKLVSACLEWLQIQGSNKKHITIAYHAPKTLSSNAPLLKALVSHVTGEQFHKAKLMNVANSTAWFTLNLPKALPAVKVLEQAKQADHILFLDKLTDKKGVLNSPLQGLAQVLFEPYSLDKYSNRLDDLFAMHDIQSAISNKVRLLAYNASRFVANSAVSGVQIHHVHPGMLALSNDITSHQLFAENYLHSVLNNTPKLSRSSQSLTWFQTGGSRDPMTIAHIEKALQKSGVKLNKVQLV